jgi:hypothetical protein
MSQVPLISLLSDGRQGPAGPPGIPGPAGGSAILRTAATTLSGHRVVKALDNGQVNYADNTLADALTVCGITTGAVIGGAVATVQASGSLTEPSWTWVAGPVYLAANGNLTQSVPVSGVVLQVGVALSATELFIDIKTPIALI